MEARRPKAIRGKKAVAESNANIQKKIDEEEYYLTTDEYNTYVAHTTDKDKIKTALTRAGFI